MKPGQLLIALGAAVAVVIALVVSGGGGGDGKSSSGNGTTPVAKAPKGAVRVTFAYSPEKEGLLVPLVKQFNAQRTEVGGKPVFVEAVNASSGDVESRVARGKYQPVAWSPSSSLWGGLLNYEADKPLAPADAPSIVRTPLVFAMWEPMARALGYPKKPIGFSDILDLATNGTGWGKYGHPEYGEFKLVHTNPDYSTSGLSAVIAEYYAATGKKEGLTEADLNSPKVRREVKAIEQSIVHYGDTTLYISDQLRQRGLGYASAVAMEEATLVDFNAHRGSQPKLVGIYPKEGTFYSDDPFIVLDAPWVTADQRAGAKAFQAFLAKEITPSVAAKGGFRPADFDAKPVAPIDAEHGADPAQPTRVLHPPEPQVLAAAKKAWRVDRKPANILLVLDTSGSMQDEDRLVRAKEGLKIFFREVGQQDSVGLLTFNQDLHLLSPIKPFATNRTALESAVRGLVADGGTAFRDAAVEAFKAVRDLDDRERINAVVLLTDGEDTDSSRSFEQALDQLGSQGDSENQVRLYTIAYSAGAAEAQEQLNRLAEATGGKGYEGTTDDIESVYRSISSFF
ncbi:MAG: Ca-activated chloride channel [Solirubrobacteraceae bacterium]|nr:Ca-activated chloride channel [Solirubrobacteraceae bacterium]